MSRGTFITLAALALFLLLAPAGLDEPGPPSAPRGDEATHLSAVRSLLEDGDLRCGPADLRRLFETYPFAVQPELVLRGDPTNPTFDANTAYTLAAAPFVALLGAPGARVLGVLVLVLTVVLLVRRLGRENADIVAAILAVGGLVLGPALIYAWLIDPTILALGLVALAVVGGWPDPRTAGWSRRRLLAVHLGCGAALGVATTIQPTFALLALPFVARLLHQRHPSRAAAWALGGLVAWAGLGLVDDRLAGPTATDLDAVWRVTIDHPLAPLPEPPASAAASPSAGTARTLAYSWFGRHVGLVPSLPFAWLAVLLFGLGRKRGGLRWSLLATLVAIVAIQAWWLAHPGGGAALDTLLRAPAHRGLVPLLPAFLALIPAVRWRAAPLAACGIAALLSGPLVLAPFGAPVAEATVHAHTRAPLARIFPLELRWLDRLPDYTAQPMLGGTLWRRQDETFVRGDLVGALGGITTELWWARDRPLNDLTLLAYGQAAGNEIQLALGDHEAELTVPDLPHGGPPARLRLEPGNRGPTLADGRRLTRMRITTRRGARPRWRGATARDDYLGVELAILGDDEHLGRDLYQASWQACSAPARVTAGDDFSALASVRNDAEHSWPNEGAARVRFGYRWLDAAGETRFEGPRRSDLETPVPPGGTVEQWVAATAPAVPGTYLLEVDLVFEHVAWFGPRSGATCRTGVEVVTR